MTAPFFDLILKNGKAATPGGIVEADIAIKDGKIASLGRFDQAAQVIDCQNLHILPGIIDSHVHFREPGLTYKEDLSTGTLSAILGGVTSIFEMPNTDPLTLTAADIADKLARSENRAFCDYAFYVGGCAENTHLLASIETMPGCAGIKVFMGSSTGALLAARDAEIEAIFKQGTRRVALHAEDEFRLIERKQIVEKSRRVQDHPVWRDAQTALIATTRAVALAHKTNRPIHLLHVTTADEMAFLQDHKDIATIETTPQHLTLFSPDCYDRLSTLAQMNPPIRDKSHQEALWQAIANGLIDTLGSDHAPHTRDEKAKPYPQSPSGMTGVQTLLPVMLTHVAAGKLSLLRLVDLLCAGPQRVYGIRGKGRIAVGSDADFAIVDLNKKWTIRNSQMASKSGWTPFDGFAARGFVTGTILRGRVMQWEGEVCESPKGIPVRFFSTAAHAPGCLPESTITRPTAACC